MSEEKLEEAVARLNVLRFRLEPVEQHWGWTAEQLHRELRHVLHTLAATSCAPGQALFVGDMPIDVHAARNSGIDVAVVATGSSTSEALRAAAPDHYLERFSDLLKIVLS